MNRDEVIRNNTGYEFCVRRFEVIDRNMVALLETRESEQPYVLVTGLRILPSGRYAWDTNIWFSNFASAIYQYDVERVKRRNERYA